MKVLQRCSVRSVSYAFSSMSNGSDPANGVRGSESDGSASDKAR